MASTTSAIRQFRGTKPKTAVRSPERQPYHKEIRMTAAQDPAAQAMVEYNYAHFDEHIEHEQDSTTAGFRQSLHVGERAADFALTRLDDGQQVRLSELWRSKPLVMEFGSFT
jgi:hypothetical protein